MIKRAADGMGLRYGNAGKRLEGAAFTRFMGQLNDYLGVFEKANKHMRNNAVTELLPRFELMRRSDFEGDGNVPPKLAKLHASCSRWPNAASSKRGRSAIRRRTPHLVGQLYR